MADPTKVGKGAIGNGGEELDVTLREGSREKYETAPRSGHSKRTGSCKKDYDHLPTNWEGANNTTQQQV